MTLSTTNRRVTLVNDPVMDYPEMYLDVWLAPETPREGGLFAQMFTKAKCRKAKSPEKADLIVFGGGSDVNPKLYQAESVHDKTSFLDSRDNADILLFNLAKEKGIPMFGVCRGAQFLHVMHGGILYQDVDGHYGDHGMFDLQTETKLPFLVSSVHHQMVVKPSPSNGMRAIATAHGATQRWLDANRSVSGGHPDIEAYYYRDSLTFGVQGHPEYSGYHEFAKWTLEKINDLIVLCPDTKWVDGNLRIDPDILAMRNTVLAQIS